MTSLIFRRTKKLKVIALSLALSFFEIFEMLWPAGLLLVARSAVATFVARPRLAVAWMDGGSLDRVQKLSSSRLVGNDHHKFRNSIVSVGSFFGEKMKPLFPKMFLKMC